MLSNNNVVFSFLNWLQYISPIKYCAEALLSNELRNDPHGIRETQLDFVDYRLGYTNCLLIFVGLIVSLRIIAYIFFRVLVSKFQ